MAVSGFRAVAGKLDRAAKHRGDLEVAIDTWLDGPPPAFGVSTREAEDGWFNVRLHELRAPPIEIGHIFADLVGNARSALDYLVWELVKHAGHEPDDNNAFPICRRRTDWPSSSGGRLKGVADWAVAKIESLQPYHADEPRHHALVVVNEARRITTHRTTLPAVTSTFEWEMNYTYSVPVEQVEHRPVVHDGPIKDGSIIASLRPHPVGGQLSAELKPDATIGMGFDVGIPGGVDIAGALDETEALVRTFEADFAERRS